MSALDSFLDQAWNDHAEQAPAVAARLREGLPLVQDDDGVMRLATLAHHVLGEHLARWQEGLAFLESWRNTARHEAPPPLRSRVAAPACPERRRSPTGATR